MQNEKTSIVFFGSGPVASESLKLLSSDFEIEAVVTKPTTKKEMEMVAGDSRVYCVANKKELDKLFSDNRFSSKLGILIDFGIIVSQKIIDYFPMGIINSHFSLLPKLRGADPISYAILEGLDKTGVSLMMLVEAMDEGPILAVGDIQLSGKETTPVLTADLINLSYSLLVDAVPRYINQDRADKISPISQEQVCEAMGIPFEPSYTRKLTKQDGIIDWTMSAQQIEREIRAYLNWPKSQAIVGDFDCIITKAHTGSGSGSAGDLFMEGQKLAVYCGENTTLVIDSLKPAGKKEMDSQSFLSGYKARLDI